MKQKQLTQEQISYRLDFIRKYKGRFKDRDIAKVLNISKQRLTAICQRHKIKNNKNIINEIKSLYGQQK